MCLYLIANAEQEHQLTQGTQHKPILPHLQNKILKLQPNETRLKVSHPLIALRNEYYSLMYFYLHRLSIFMNQINSRSSEDVN